MASVWWWAWAWAWVVLMAVSPTQAAGRGGIKGEPRVTSPWESPKVVREGETVRLTCPITATPEPFYEWFKDGEEIRATWNRYNPKKKTLKVRGATREDAGFFTCVGVNGFGKINASMSLIVLREGEPNGDLMEPELTEVWPKGTLQRHMGERLTLTCRAKGLPTPSVTWYKDGLLLSHEGAQLTFSSLDTSDSGSYTCRANSALGGTAANFSLQVGDNSEEKELEISETVNTTVMEGGTTSLQCTVRTSHQPRVQWLKEISPESPEEGGAPLTNITKWLIPRINKRLGGRWFRKVEGAGGVVARGDGHYLSKLTISHATPRSEGVYVCLAVNTLGFSFREAHLTVLSPREKPDTPVGEKESSVNWLFLIIPGVVVVVVVVAVIVCQLRKSSPDKPVGVTPPTPVLKGDDASALTPLNQDASHAHPPSLPRPPDLVYQEVSGYTSGSVRGGVGGGVGHHHHHHYDQYPNSYPESYVDPAYSDPYGATASAGERGPTRASEHSYARLTHPSLASHASSSSPHLPPPYVHPPHPHPHAHTHSHTHKHPQYFVHYNL